MVTHIPANWRHTAIDQPLSVLRSWMASPDIDEFSLQDQARLADIYKVAKKTRRLRNLTAGIAAVCAIAVAAGVMPLVPIDLLLGALPPLCLLAIIGLVASWAHENAFDFNDSKVNQSLRKASAINARQQDRPTKGQQAQAITTTTRSFVWLNSEQTRFRYSDDPAWLTRNCRPGQPDFPPRSLGTNRPTEPQVQRGPRGGRYYLVRSKNGQRYRKYF